MAHPASIWSNYSDLTRPKNPPNGGLLREMGPLISGKSRLVKYYFIWPDQCQIVKSPGVVSTSHVAPIS